MKKKAISICIPTYNRADLIGTTLQSVANQTIKPDEVLIIDNASTDNTQEIIKKFLKYGFKYITNKKNIGMAENLNLCVELAKNEHFTFLPSDDLIAPTWYEEWVKVINKTNADLYTSPLTIMNNVYKPIWGFPIFKKSRLIQQPNVMQEFCHRFTPGLAPNAASIYKKSVFKKIAKFDPKEGAECDVRVAMKLFDICTVYYYHKFLFVFREHDVRSFDLQKQSRNEAFLEKVEHYFSILSDVYRKRYNNDQKYRYIIQTKLFMTLCNINLYIVRGEFNKIIKSYQSCFSHFPDILRKSQDWPEFIRIQLELIRRGLMMYRISKEIKKQLLWLDSYRTF